MNKPQLVIIAWGNESRGDDAVGPILANRLSQLELDNILVIEDLQLNIEHIMDLQSQIPVMFIDTSCQISKGYRLEKIHPKPDNSISTHSVSPEALLNLFEKTMQCTAPPAFLLHVAGSQFELGQATSSNTSMAIEEVWQFLLELLDKPKQSWQQELETSAI